MSKLIITCKEATLISIKNEERASTISEYVHFWLHLSLCTYCRLFNKQSRFLNRHVKQISSNEKLTDAEKAALIEKIKKSLP